MGLLEQLFDRAPPADETLWHKWNTLLMPVRTLDGSIAVGEVWRRYRGGRYEYQKRPEESAEDWADRQW